MTVRYGTETVSYMVPKVWSKVTQTIKMRSYMSYQNEKPECVCRLCAK